MKESAPSNKLSVIKLLQHEFVKSRRQITRFSSEEDIERERYHPQQGVHQVKMFGFGSRARRFCLNGSLPQSKKGK